MCFVPDDASFTGHSSTVTGLCYGLQWTPNSLNRLSPYNTVYQGPEKQCNVKQ